MSIVYGKGRIRTFDPNRANTYTDRQDLGDTWGPDCGRNQCLDGCTEDKVMAWQEGYYDTFGNFHKEAGEVCGDGSAGRTYASSTTWGISLQAGPDLVSSILGQMMCAQI